MYIRNSSNSIDFPDYSIFFENYPVWQYKKSQIFCLKRKNLEFYFYPEGAYCSQEHMGQFPVTGDIFFQNLLSPM